MLFRVLLGALAVGTGGVLLAERIANRQTMSPSVASPSPPPALQVTNAAPVPLPRMVVLQADRRGHFAVDLGINNLFVKAMIDTGASVVAFSHEDAQRIGIRVSPGDDTVPVQTANGLVRVARARIPEIRLQGLVVRDVEAAIMPPGALGITLLGMSFLKRLKGFEMNGNTLVLKQ